SAGVPRLCNKARCARATSMRRRDLACRAKALIGSLTVVGTSGEKSSIEAAEAYSPTVASSRKRLTVVHAPNTGASLERISQSRYHAAAVGSPCRKSKVAEE